jgi:hypothetical protein
MHKNAPQLFLCIAPGGLTERSFVAAAYQIRKAISHNILTDDDTQGVFS